MFVLFALGLSHKMCYLKISKVKTGKVMLWHYDTEWNRLNSIWHIFINASTYLL